MKPAETAPVHARSLDRAIDAATRWLWECQERPGYWVGRLESNSSMEAEWILAMHFLGVEDDPKYEGVVRAILKRQRTDGSWETFRNAPEGDISATVECYAALRRAGLDPDGDELTRARQWIFAHGGLGGIRVFTKMWLALIGEWPWEGTPALPPELILLPTWFPLNIYRFSSWARATLVPLAVVSARRPVRPLPPGRRLDELFPDGREAVDYSLPHRAPRLSWENFFLTIDRFLRWYARSPWTPGRDKAIRICLEWIIRHQDADGAWGGIQPPWIYSLIALNVMDYGVDHPVMAKGLDGFNEPWAVREDDAIFLQASNSPVWDTWLTLLALLDCGVSYVDSAPMQRALAWALNEEVRTPGDWQVMAPDVEPGGWAFEWENNCYPDLDDTAVALIVLTRLWDSPAREHLPAAVSGAVARARNWMLALQSTCGGWASFDKDNEHVLVTKIPFCDFGEVLDPPSVDVTGHAIEALGLMGFRLDEPAVRRAVDFILAEQEPDGSWFGRWGVNYIYGTGAVLPGLEAVGFDMSRPETRRAAEWLVAHQNQDGGWGETCSSYMDESLRGRGESTASQTAWALMGLLAVDARRYREAILRGVEFLTRTQTPEGTWNEPQYTGTGFPGYGVGRRTNLRVPRSTLPQGRELGRAFMINYNLYRHYFPVMALGRARRALALD
ncbi:MAG: squalene--hopene cyclase [Bryobacteraceae bacterium]